MQTADISSSNFSPAVSILQTANKEPQLAGELISKTVENLMQTQLAQSSAQLLSSPQTGVGIIINTTA